LDKNSFNNHPSSISYHVLKVAEETIGFERKHPIQIKMEIPETLNETRLDNEKMVN